MAIFDQEMLLATKSVRRWGKRIGVGGTYRRIGVLECWRVEVLECWRFGSKEGEVKAASCLQVEPADRYTFDCATAPDELGTLNAHTPIRPYAIRFPPTSKLLVASLSVRASVRLNIYG